MGLNIYAYVGGNSLGDTDPTGEVGLGGFIFGSIAGGVSGYISSGGKWQGAALGAAAGGAIGVFNPYSATVAGSAAGSFLSSVVAQGAGNWLSCRDITDIDLSLATISALGSGSGVAIGKVLATPTRNAFSYQVSLQMGQGNATALKSLQSVVKGTGSGLPQLVYKWEFYPSNYPADSCARPVGCP